MTIPDKQLQWYIRLWNVRLHYSNKIEVVCPKCKGCATPYFVASLNKKWDLAKMELLANSLPFPTQIETLQGKNGYKLLSFPGMSLPHPDIFLNHHNGEIKHLIPIVTQCSDCYDRAVFGDRVQVADLYWSVETRHGVLWSYSRDWLVKIRNIIEGTDRPRGPITSRLPAEMLKASNRSEMIKLIDRVLLSGPQR